MFAGRSSAPDPDDRRRTREISKRSLDYRGFRDCNGQGKFADDLSASASHGLVCRTRIGKRS